MVRIEKNGLIREVASLEAAQEFIRQGYSLREVSKDEVKEQMMTDRELRDELAKLTVEQLTAQCKELGIEIPGAAKKSNLIDLLVQNTAGAAED